MPAGRPAKPVEQHLIEGTFRPDRHRLPVMVSDKANLAEMDPPAHLTTFQQRVWKEIVPYLDSIVQMSDLATVEGAVIAFAQYREAQNRIEEDGAFIYNRFDELRAHPALAVRDRALRLFLEFSTRLGLSPSDRARLGIDLGSLAKTTKDLFKDEFGDPFEEPGTLPASAAAQSDDSSS